MKLRRLEAEALRDSILAVSGKLDRKPGGPAVMREIHPDGLQTISTDEPYKKEQYRRSLYIFTRRNHPLDFLRVFDYPIIDTNCTRRVTSATPLQSLTMMNGEFVTEQASYLQQRLFKEAGQGSSTQARVSLLYRLTLQREPTASEQRICEEHLRKEAELYSNSNSQSADPAQSAFVSLAQALLSSNEFLYID